MRYFNIFIILIIGFTFSLNKTIEKSYDYNIDTTFITDIEKLETEVVVNEPLNIFYGNVTAYTPYCEGCIGITASGYDVRNTIYYNDTEYGNVRIVAADSSIPFGTVIKLENMINYDDLITIVLDRGSAIGYDTTAQIDLLFNTNSEAIDFGRQYNVKLEILRYGY